MTSCHTCELTRRRDSGGAPLWDSIVRTPAWDVVHSYDTSVLGWLVVALRRHATSVGELTDADAAELGPLIRDLSRALEHVTGCPKTYVVQFAEHPLHPHVHLHVIPRAADLPSEQTGPGIFTRLGVPAVERVTPDTMNAFARELRRELSLSRPIMPMSPPRPPSEPVVLKAASRSDRALLENLGQLYRYDLSESYGLLPNPDGTFNNRRLDAFRTGADASQQMWLIMVAGGLGGFVLTSDTPDSGRTISDFFVVRALRRTGVGREAARQVIALFSGHWKVGFQSYNPGAEAFWTRVAAEAAPNAWTMFDDPPVDGRPPDSWIVFHTN